MIYLEDTLNGRPVRAKVTAAPFGMGPNVKLQIKVWFWWETEDSMIPYDSKNPDKPVAELVEWAVDELFDRCVRRGMRASDLHKFLNE